MFMEQWQAAKPAHCRWGELVLQRLHKLIAARVPASQAGHFSRIPTPPRIKDDQSLLQKAFFRPEKSYPDPFIGIEDKVGVRLVLLLDEDVRMMAQAIETESEFWSAVRARDHEAERELHPYEFVYGNPPRK
jgi:ppGpp synthetase/RelA/SpoT-type nucleotidyltranferase